MRIPHHTGHQFPPRADVRLDQEPLQAAVSPGRNILRRALEMFRRLQVDVNQPHLGFVQQLVSKPLEYDRVAHNLRRCQGLFYIQNHGFFDNRNAVATQYLFGFIFV